MPKASQDMVLIWGSRWRALALLLWMQIEICSILLTTCREFVLEKYGFNLIQSNYERYACFSFVCRGRPKRSTFWWLRTVKRTHCRTEVRVGPNRCPLIGHIHHIASYCIILHHTTSYYIILHHTTSYYIIIHHIIIILLCKALHAIL